MTTMSQRMVSNIEKVLSYLYTCKDGLFYLNIDLDSTCILYTLECRGPAPADPGYSKERLHRQGSGNNCLIKR